MPYITETHRKALEDSDPQNAGELNYAITQVVNRYLCLKGSLSYSVLNEAIGALECAKQELYRRVAAPYEDIKMRENGDVYDRRFLT